MLRHLAPHSFSLIPSMAFLASVMAFERMLRKANFPRPAQAGLAGGRAGLCALASMLFIPPGSLAPAWNAPAGGLLWLLLMAASEIFQPSLHGEDTVSDGRLLRLLPLVICGTGLALLSAYAFQRALPGSMLNLGTFVATPVWSVANWPGAVGMAMLSAGLVVACPPLHPERSADFFSGPGLRAISYTAFVCALCLPRPLFLLFGFSSFPAADYVAFWLTVSLALALRACLPLGRATLLFALGACLSGGALLLWKR